MSISAISRSCSSGSEQDVADDVLHEHRRAGADECDLGHVVFHVVISM